MAASFTIKKNDRLPAIEAICKDSDGNPVDLTSATAAKFIMKAAASGTAKVNATATITSPTAGLVRYDWAASDTDTSGTYNAEFEITFPTSLPMTFPNSEYIVINVVSDLG